MFIVLIVLYKDVVIDYIEILLSTSNGFIPRYFSSDSLFAGNFEVLQRAILGIGFTIPSSNYSVYYADSGFIIYYTMGGMLFLIGMYYLFYVYIKKNLGSYWIYFLFAVVIFDLGMPSLIYSRFLYLWILSTLFIGSIHRTTI